MISFYEFSRKLDEVGGGSLTNWLNDLQQPAAKTAAPVKPKAAAIGPGRSPMQTSPAGSLPTPQTKAPSIGPVKDQPITVKEKGTSVGRFAHNQLPGSPEETRVTDRPVPGIAPSRQLNMAHRMEFGPDGPPETRALQIHPVIMDLKKQNPDLAAALMAINGPFSKNKPFTMAEVDPKVNQDEVIAALQLLKQQKRLDFEDARGNPARLNRADLPTLRIVPSDSYYRGDKSDLRLPSQDQRDAADRETEISPRYSSSKDKVGKPRPGAGPAGAGPAGARPTTTPPGTKAQDLGLRGVDLVRNKMDTLTNILGGLARRGATGEKKHQDAINKVWSDIEQMAAGGGRQEQAAAQAWKQEIERAAVKAGLSVPGQARECVEWLNYYNLMETYRPSAR